ncbi:hypothetical protein MJC1_02706 [Methylocystis sp. MJC1]|nr:hypothetical protein MJC1_02706 [Methylocystis sp. MJC1]
MHLKAMPRFREASNRLMVGQVVMIKSTANRSRHLIIEPPFLVTEFLADDFSSGDQKIIFWTISSCVFQ